MAKKTDATTAQEMIASMGRNLRHIRENVLHLSREEAAKRAGVSANTIVRYEKGDVGRFEELYLVCEGLGISLLDLMARPHAEKMIASYARTNPYSRAPTADSLAIKMFLINPEHRPDPDEPLDDAVARVAEYERGQDVRFADKLIAEAKAALDTLPPEGVSALLIAILRILPNHELAVSVRLIRSFVSNPELFSLAKLADELWRRARDVPNDEVAEVAQPAGGNRSPQPTRAEDGSGAKGEERPRGKNTGRKRPITHK